MADIADLTSSPDERSPPPLQTLPRSGNTTDSCTATLLASVFDQVSAAPAEGRQVSSRRVRRSARGQSAGQEPEAAGDTSGLPDLSYLAYSSDEEFEEFM